MSIHIQKDVHLASHTVFKIGGAARFFTQARSKEELLDALVWAGAYKLRFFILGAGSNTLISEKGFDGLVIKPVDDSINFLGDTIIAGAGTMMPQLAAAAARAGLSGLEWAAGIPGTVGGSVRGNAGCFGSDMGSIVDTVYAYDTIVKHEKKISHKDCAFTYRNSMFKSRPELVIMAASLSLKTGDTKTIHARMKEHMMHRAHTQAIGEKCAGCIFKNVPWADISFSHRQKLLHRIPQMEAFRHQTHIPAAVLIDALGLKGYRIGNAYISQKHANFFINAGGATADDVMMLISHCKEYVHRKTGILLHEEIHYV